MIDKLEEKIRERIIKCCSLVYGFGQSSQLSHWHCQLKNENVRVEEKRTIEDICKMIKRK